MATRHYHNPVGEPCRYVLKDGTTCGAARRFHRPEHHPQGDPCTRVGGDGLPCGLEASRHYRKVNTGSGSLRGRGCYFAGIDGEGQTSNRHEENEDHRYTSLSWSNESGSRSAIIEAPPGGRLTTEQCLDFILATPEYAKLFAFAFNYDLTKILTDVSDAALYILFRPELRRRNPGFEKYGPTPVRWKGYLLNLQGSQFTVKRGKVRRTIWDIFKFYQKRFTTVLTDWHKSVKPNCPRCAHLATDCEPCRDWPRHKANIEQMRLMKEKRHLFDKLSPQEVNEYCFSECRYMATIARKLVEATDAAGERVYGDPTALRLRKFHGAGSIASAFLKKMGINKAVRKAVHTPGRYVTDPEGKTFLVFDPIEEMRIPVASAFAGGRFENRVLGAVRRRVCGWDISSAYPYQITNLPCLEHGKWELTRDRRHILTATAACVHYRLHAPPNGKPPTWGPFPFRTKDGSITFPGQSGGGWVWRDEYVAGEALFSRQVEFIEAWVYNTDCGHKPHADVPRFYLERLRIGKEGPGYILKLGPNAMYGKEAQSLGHDPPYQSWPWSGMTTSGCRAQMLQLMALHTDLRDLLMIATDGAYTTADITPPAPMDTGTGPDRARDEKGKPVDKPLGGWEGKTVEKGLFLARPGIYFPLDPTEEEIENIRARGLGRAVMFASAPQAVEAWEQGLSRIQVANVSRFHGAKSSIFKRFKAGKFQFQRAPRYGQWTTKEVVLDFNPLPKREYPEGYTPGQRNRWPVELTVRMMPKDLESAPYRRALKNYGPDVPLEEYYGGAEAVALRKSMLEMMEQPDGGDYSDYEQEEYFSDLANVG